MLWSDRQPQKEKGTMSKEYEDMTPDERADYWALVAIGGMVGPSNLQAAFQAYVRGAVERAYRAGYRDGQKASPEG
jgi:hypothetical protein